MRLRPIGFAPFLITMLAGCTGYALVPARLNIADVTPGSFPAVAATLHEFLVIEGFEDFGKDQKMIALLRQGDARQQYLEREVLARLNRAYTYLNDKHDLRVVITDYVDGMPPEISLDYVPTSGHFIELEVTDNRPGGFDAYALAFYDRLVGVLKKSYGASVRVIELPPPTNAAEYRRITTENTIGGIFWWCLAFGLPFLVTGSVTRYVLQKVKIQTNLKRVIFTVINTWLVAPVPLPAAYITVIPLANVFAFPWTSTDFYQYDPWFTKVSFSMTFLLCAISSWFLFRISVEAEPLSPVA